ncbi:hypothetical protein D3P96_07555 [Weissella viridescens]|uniref:Uncharacterized protein n=1 Tax=Weissella viridescens TaxID=1629 RepID=A0A3P2RAJ8_WEIVI|nr:hypothetical protein D3P96_07555 [Weissella viridescens]
MNLLISLMQFLKKTKEKEISPIFCPGLRLVMLKRQLVQIERFYYGYECGMMGVRNNLRWRND